MAIDFQRSEASFPSHSGSPQTQELTFVFPSNVVSAVAALGGFGIGFTQSDHHLFRTHVFATVTSVVQNVVRVSVEFALRDSSGFFDDRYDGVIAVIVMAERV